VVNSATMNLLEKLAPFALLHILVAVTGCGGDDSDEPGGNSGLTCAAPNSVTTGCSVVVEPGSADDATALLDVFIDAKSGDTVCLCPGTFTPNKEISLTVPGVTVRGAGQNVEDTVLDFATQDADKNAFSVTSDGFTVENLWLKNSPGNGIVVTGAEDVTFRKLKVSWDAGSVVSNGAYAVYPVQSKRVIIEDSEIVGAADAGAYVGQCEGAIVRNNKVHGNVAGIEIENTTDAEVYGNEAYDNTSGILVFVLPNLEKKDGMAALVRDNDIHDNNRKNFAEPGTIVASVPPGTGMLLLAADSTEIRNNTISNNGSVGILIVSQSTIDQLLGTTPDPETNGFAEGSFIHDNTFTNNGTDPQTLLLLLGKNPVENIVWDGVVDAGATETLCLGDSPEPSFRNMQDSVGDPADDLLDSSAHMCTKPPLPALSW
jgi:parallel beta-helix repeat protein